MQRGRGEAGLARDARTLPNPRSASGGHPLDLIPAEAGFQMGHRTSSRVSGVNPLSHILGSEEEGGSEGHPRTPGMTSPCTLFEIRVYDLGFRVCASGTPLFNLYPFNDRRYNPYQWRIRLAGLGHLPLKEEIGGSNPPCATNHLISLDFGRRSDPLRLRQYPFS